MSVLVVDVGTSGIKVAVIDPEGGVRHDERRAFPPATPFPGMVEFDAAAMGTAVVEMSASALAGSGPVTGIGITAQRASTVVWDRRSGEPIAPGIGWQDLRTVFDCITLRAEHGIALAPNQSATKLTWLLNTHDPGRERDLCFGTVDSWIAWVLSRGSVHATDHTNAAVTGLTVPAASEWSGDVLRALNVPPAMMPAIVDTSGIIGEASALRGAPPLAALVGDQQGSLVGQGCVQPGMAKITFGTGGMLDVCLDGGAPASSRRTEHGTFPIVAWSAGGRLTWGAEAIMLAAGSNVDWLRDDLGIIASSSESHEVAARCTSTGGVVFVPALLGLGTPHWDFGARGTMLGLTRGSGRAEVVRAVLEGVAHRGTDLVEAAEAHLGRPIERLRVDGGMSENPTFVQALADASGKAVEVSPHTEATTLGAAYLAGLATGVWTSLDDTARMWRPRAVIEPGAPLDRGGWARAVERAREWMPELSALDF